MDDLFGRWIITCGLLWISLGFHALHGSRLQISVTPKSEPMWYVEGSPLMLVCTVLGHLEDGELEWWKNGIPVDSQFVTESKDTTGTEPRTTLTYTKEKGERDDQGNYYCTTNGRGDAEKAVDMITVTARDVNLTIGFQTTLACDIEPYYEQKSITWYKGKTLLTKIPELEGRLTLGPSNETATIMNSKKTDAGNYTCIIKYNPNTEMEQTFKQSLGIKGLPIFTNSRTNELISLTNTSLLLQCPASGYPKPEVFWLLGDDVIQPSDHYTMTSINNVENTQLEVLNPSTKDYVTYVCALENEMGMVKLKLDVYSYYSRYGGGNHVAVHTLSLYCIIIVTVLTIWYL